MATYVLVHGGHNDGLVWEKVVPFLKKEGHAVFFPTLADPDKTTLDGHISEVCALIENNRLENVILAGHSYGAMVITGTADRIPERIERLVYIDSVVPGNGESLFGIMEVCGAGYQKFGLVPTGPLLIHCFLMRKRSGKYPRPMPTAQRASSLSWANVLMRK